MVQRQWHKKVYIEIVVWRLSASMTMWQRFLLFSGERSRGLLLEVERKRGDDESAPTVLELCRGLVYHPRLSYEI